MSDDLFQLVRETLWRLHLHERLELLEQLIATIAEFGPDAVEQLQGGVNPIVVLKAQAALRRIRQDAGDPHERLAELFGVSSDDIALITQTFDEGTIYNACIRVPKRLEEGWVDQGPAAPQSENLGGDCKNWEPNR